MLDLQPATDVLAHLVGAVSDDQLTAPSPCRETTLGDLLDLPGDVAGVVALDEIVVHGWDIAAASGQIFACEPQLLAAAYGFVEATVADHPQGSPGLFGPPVPVPVPGSAPLLDRLLGLTGRDPGWRRAASPSS